MTPSAARGVLEAIYWKPEFDYVITGIEVLAPIRWVSIRRNEVTSMVTLDWVRTAMADPAVRFDVESGRDQRNTVFLRDVAYRIRAQVTARSAPSRRSNWRSPLAMAEVRNYWLPTCLPIHPAWRPPIAAAEDRNNHRTIVANGGFVLAAVARGGRGSQLPEQVG